MKRFTSHLVALWLLCAGVLAQGIVTLPSRAQQQKREVTDPSVVFGGSWHEDAGTYGLRARSARGDYDV